MEVIPVRFPAAAGHLLDGRVHAPRQPVGVALFAHCFTCGKDVLAAVRIARRLAACGLAVLRFDFTGLGDSEGDFSATGHSSNVQDLIAAADFLRATREGPALLVGHSLGGAAVLAAAAAIPDCRAVVTIGAPSDPAHVAGLFPQSVPEILAEGHAKVRLAGRELCVGRAFLEDISAQNLARRIAELGRPLLVMHGPDDSVVSIDHAAAIYAAARHPKSFIALDGSDHLLSRRADADRAARLIATWSARYLGAED